MFPVMTSSMMLYIFYNFECLQTWLTLPNYEKAIREKLQNASQVGIFKKSGYMPDRTSHDKATSNVRWGTDANWKKQHQPILKSAREGRQAKPRHCRIRSEKAIHRGKSTVCSHLSMSGDCFAGCLTPFAAHSFTPAQSVKSGNKISKSYDLCRSK